TDLFGRTLYEQVEIDVNPELLEGIAKTTGGGAYQATDRATLESGLAQVLDSLEKSKIYEASAAPSYDEWAARLFLPAAFCALFDVLRGDRVGIVACAGEAFVQCPLTIDYSAAKLFLRAVDPAGMPQQGTAIAAALDESRRLLEGGSRGGAAKAVLLISDGED